LELVVPKLRPGGLLIAENVISHAQELQDYLQRVKSHPQQVPMGNGEEIALKLG
jgi:predicted O-methyltransferase YrrM